MTPVIYRIFNTVNGKSYIGQTIDFRQRMNTHFSKLRRAVHNSEHLQSAFQKYGEDAFDVEILETLDSEEGLNEREIYWIAHFDSYDNGYNLTRGGDDTNESTRRSCVWNGVEYTSVNEAARALNVSPSALRNRLKMGYTSDTDFRSNQPRPISYNGVLYPSIAEAARANKVTSATMKARIDKGWTGDESRKAGAQVILDGVVYASVNEAARTLGASEDAIRTRISIEKTPLSDSIEIDGTSFKSLKTAAMHYNVSIVTIRYWIRSGGNSLPLNENSLPKPVQINDITFKSIGDAARHFEVDHKTIRNWIKRGAGRFI